MKASDIRIPEPCSEDWQGMTPAQRGRFCAACQKHVHDLSAMTEREANALLGSGQDICVSYLSDSSGAVRFRPQPVVPASRLVRRASAVTAAGFGLALAACAPHAPPPELDDTEAFLRTVTLDERVTIPDAEPCETVTHEEQLIRTKGDYAPPMPEVEPEPEGDPEPPAEPETRPIRRKGRPARRTAGKPMPRKHPLE